MAQNVTIMGASYPDVPAVDLPKTGGGTARFADPSVTTAVAADVAAGKIFLNAQGEPTTGTGSGGGGVFAINLTLNTSTQMWEPDKTLAQIRAAYDAGKTPVAYAPIDEWNSNDTYCKYQYDSEEDYFSFVYQVTWFDYDVILNGNWYHDAYMLDADYGLQLIDRQDTKYPMTLVPKTITSNGTYDPATEYADGYSQVTVNVQSAGGGNIDTKTATAESYPTSLTFTGLYGTPTAWFLRATSQITVSTSTSQSYYYIIAMRYNGAGPVGNLLRCGGTRRVENVTSGYSYTYSNGTLTITSSAASRSASPGAFYSGNYELVYIY